MPIRDGRKRAGAIEILQAWGHDREWDLMEDDFLFSWVTEMDYVWDNRTGSWIAGEYAKGVE